MIQDWCDRSTSSNSILFSTNAAAPRASQVELLRQPVRLQITDRPTPTNAVLPDNS